VKELPMLDVKMSKQAVKKKSKRRKTPISQPSLNHMFYSASWTVTTLTAGTSGQISMASGFSISNSSEYSNLQTIFSEVRLRRVTFSFSCRFPQDTGVHSRAQCGTRMEANQTTFTNPSAFTDVQNLAGRREFTDCFNGLVNVRAVVPKQLDFTSLVADVPTLVSPWAGSPGSLYLYGDGFTVSRDVFTVVVRGTWELRGRH
jgi:hypothetical protein